MERVEKTKELAKNPKWRMKMSEGLEPEDKRKMKGDDSKRPKKKKSNDCYSNLRKLLPIYYDF